MKKSVLVLGGSGFIGNNLCRHLSKLDFNVFSMDIILPTKKIGGVKYLQGDFFDELFLQSIAENMDFIVHAISTINPGNSNDRFMQGYEKDFLQTVRLCKMLIGKKTKMVFLSSGGTVYGNCEKQPISENVMPCPINHYGNIKLCIENTMRAFNCQMNNKMVIVRISNPYGQGQDFHKGVGFIDAVLRNSIAGHPIEIWGDGEIIRDYIHIEDVCKMITAILEYTGEYDTFNVSSGIGVSQNMIIKMAKKMGLRPRIVYKEPRKVDVKKIILDNSRVKSIYQKKLTGLEEGLADYYSYLNCLYGG